MRVQTFLNRLIQLPGMWVKGIRFEVGEVIITIHRRFRLLECPECGTKVRGRFCESTRRWRHIGIWEWPVFLEGAIRRLRCPRCKSVRTERVPWARPDSDFTLRFEEVVAYLAQRLNQTAVAEMVGIAWQTVGSISQRVVADKLPTDRLDGLRRIGVDEISYRRHHKYLTMVVDHDTQRVVWAAEGKSSATLKGFFEELGPARLKELEIVSIDLSAAFQKAIREMAPGVDVVFDRFHVARLAQQALDEVRREQQRELSGEERKPLKKSRWPLLKRSDNLRDKDEIKLAEIQRLNLPTYRGYLLKESFLEIFDAPNRACAEREIASWLSWASRSRLAPFVRMARTVRKHLEGILQFLDTGLTNARLEGINNKIRLLSHRAYGFHSADALIGMIELCCSGIKFRKLQLV